MFSLDFVNTTYFTSSFMSVLEMLIISFAVIQISLLVRSIFTQKQKISELRAQLNSIQLNVVPNKTIGLNYASGVNRNVLNRVELNKANSFNKVSKSTNRRLLSASIRNIHNHNIHNAA